jgi:hypothetical protein
VTLLYDAVDVKTALVVPPGDPGALAAAADRPLWDGGQRVRPGTPGTELVQRRLNWNNTAAPLQRHLVAYVADPARYQLAPTDALAGESPL